MDDYYHSDTSELTLDRLREAQRILRELDDPRAQEIDAQAAFVENMHGSMQSRVNPDEVTWTPGMPVASPQSHSEWLDQAYREYAYPESLEPYVDINGYIQYRRRSEGNLSTGWNDIIERSNLNTTDNQSNTMEIHEAFRREGVSSAEEYVRKHIRCFLDAYYEYRRSTIDDEQYNTFQTGSGENYQIRYFPSSNMFYLPWMERATIVLPHPLPLLEAAPVHAPEEPAEDDSKIVVTPDGVYRETFHRRQLHDMSRLREAFDMQGTVPILIRNAMGNAMNKWHIYAKSADKVVFFKPLRDITINCHFDATPELDGLRATPQRREARSDLPIAKVDVSLVYNIVFFLFVKSSESDYGSSYLVTLVDGQIYKFPVTNIYEGSAQVCMGNENFENPYDALESIQKSLFNLDIKDYYFPLWCKIPEISEDITITPGRFDKEQLQVCSNTLIAEIIECYG